MRGILRAFLRLARFATIAALAAAHLTPAFGALAPAPRATVVRVAANRVAVVIASPAPVPRAYLVVVRVKVSGRVRTRVVRIAATAATPVTAEVVLPGADAEVTEVGVVLDDGSPF